MSELDVNGAYKQKTQVSDSGTKKKVHTHKPKMTVSLVGVESKAAVDTTATIDSFPHIPQPIYDTRVPASAPEHVTLPLLAAVAQTLSQSAPHSRERDSPVATAMSSRPTVVSVTWFVVPIHPTLSM